MSKACLIRAPSAPETGRIRPVALARVASNDRASVAVTVAGKRRRNQISHIARPLGKSLARIGKLNLLFCD